MLLITGDNQDFSAGNKAFLDFATANKKEVLRFAYVYQLNQQPLCQALLQNQALLSPQVSVRSTHIIHINIYRYLKVVQLHPLVGKCALRRIGT